MSVLWTGVSSYTTGSSYATPSFAPVQGTASFNLPYKLVILSWGLCSDFPENYCIEEKVGAGSYALIDTVSQFTSSYARTISTPGTYTYRIRAKNGTNYSSYSNEQSITYTASATTVSLSFNASATPRRTQSASSTRRIGATATPARGAVSATRLLHISASVLSNRLQSLWNSFSVEVSAVSDMSLMQSVGKFFAMTVHATIGLSRMIATTRRFNATGGMTVRKFRSFAVAIASLVGASTTRAATYLLRIGASAHMAFTRLIRQTRRPNASVAPRRVQKISTSQSWSVSSALSTLFALINQKILRFSVSVIGVLSRNTWTIAWNDPFRSDNYTVSFYASQLDAYNQYNGKVFAAGYAGWNIDVPRNWSDFYAAPFNGRTDVWVVVTTPGQRPLLIKNIRR